MTEQDVNDLLAAFGGLAEAMKYFALLVHKVITEDRGDATFMLLEHYANETLELAAHSEQVAQHYRELQA